MIALRPYQQEILAQLRAEVSGGRDPVCVSPCGSGKGSLISFIVHSATQKGHHVIFAVHGKSLVVDMSERIAKLGIAHGVLMGGEKRERWHSVQVASIDTLHRMAHPPKASLIIADECDGALSPTWRKTISRYPNARLIGTTATPIRLDGKGLGKATGGLFDSIVLGPSEQELIDMGYLVGSRVLAPPPPADLGNVKKTAGEFNPKQQAAVCDKAKVIGDIVDHWKRHASGKKSAAFGVDQAHASHITQQFNESGVPWAYVDADTPLDERARIWRDLDEPSGRLMGVSSVGCTVVGWDHPIVSCLVVARKTASLRLHKQMLGRGSRTYPGKSEFLVLDHVGNVHYHDPYGLFEATPEWSLDGAAIKLGDGKKSPSVSTCKKCYATFRSGPEVCPYCGAVIRHKKREVEVEAGELQEVTRKLAQRPKTEQQLEYEKLLQQAVDRGKNAGWAAFIYSKRFGQFPRKEWRAQWAGEELNKEMAAQ